MHCFLSFVGIFAFSKYVKTLFTVNVDASRLVSLFSSADVEKIPILDK